MTEMKWNLVDHLSDAGSENPLLGKRRAFYLPLASIPSHIPLDTVGDRRDSINGLQETSFVPEQSSTPTDDPILTIKVNPPNEGFTNDTDDLPHPAIRLHAISNGILKIEPAEPAEYDSHTGYRIWRRGKLILKMTPFLKNTGCPAWWRNWWLANCIPDKVIYEHFDWEYFLDKILHELPLPIQSDGEEDFPTLVYRYGVAFPHGVTEDNKDSFICNFVTGNEVLAVKAGAFIGTCEINDQSSETEDNKKKRMTKLRVQYHDHREDAHRYMNPRELFNLLFGIDSPECTVDYSTVAEGVIAPTSHPMLKSMHTHGKSDQSTVYPKTRRMLLRPPLRTHKRVMWEAKLETSYLHSQWSKAGRLNPTNTPTYQRFHNEYSKNNKIFNKDSFTGYNKCNIFVFEICLRSGFRVGIHLLEDNDKYHYLSANASTNLIHRAPPSTNVRVEVNGEDYTRVLGFRLDNWFHNKSVEDINKAMTEEGRCLVWAYGKKTRWGGNPTGDCSNMGGYKGSGHIALVRNITRKPLLRHQEDKIWMGIENRKSPAGAGFYRTRVIRTYHAGRLGGAAKYTHSKSLNIPGLLKLTIFELCPGKDPDTIYGQSDLNVLCRNWDFLPRFYHELPKPKQIGNSNSFCKGTSKKDNVAFTITTSPTQGDKGPEAVLGWVINSSYKIVYYATIRRYVIKNGEIVNYTKRYFSAGKTNPNDQNQINIDIKLPVGLKVGHQYEINLSIFNKIGVELSESKIVTITQPQQGGGGNN